MASTLLPIDFWCYYRNSGLRGLGHCGNTDFDNVVFPILMDASTTSPRGRGDFANTVWGITTLVHVRTADAFGDIDGDGDIDIAGLPMTSRISSFTAMTILRAWVGSAIGPCRQSRRRWRDIRLFTHNSWCSRWRSIAQATLLAMLTSVISIGPRQCGRSFYPGESCDILWWAPPGCRYSEDADSILPTTE
jgi:hypothetical protein